MKEFMFIHSIKGIIQAYKVKSGQLLLGVLCGE